MQLKDILWKQLSELLSNERPSVNYKTVAG